MDPSNSSYLSKTAIFHFHDGRKSICIYIYISIPFLNGAVFLSTAPFISACHKSLKKYQKCWWKKCCFPVSFLWPVRDCQIFIQARRSPKDFHLKRWVHSHLKHNQRKTTSHQKSDAPRYPHLTNLPCSYCQKDPWNQFLLQCQAQNVAEIVPGTWWPSIEITK